MDKQIIKDNAKAIVELLVRNTPEYVRAYNKIDHSVERFCDKWDSWSEEKQREFYDDECVWENIECMVGCLPRFFSMNLGLDWNEGHEDYSDMTHKDIAWAAACHDVCAERGTIYRPAADNPLICFMGNEMCGLDGCDIEESLDCYDKFLDKFMEIYDLEKKFDNGELFFVGETLFSGGHSMNNMKRIKRSVKYLGKRVSIFEKKDGKTLARGTVEGGKVTAEVISLSEVGFNILAIGPSSVSYSSMLVENDGKCDSNVNADIVEAFIKKFGIAA